MGVGENGSELLPMYSNALKRHEETGQLSHSHSNSNTNISSSKALLDSNLGEQEANGGFIPNSSSYLNPLANKLKKKDSPYDKLDDSKNPNGNLPKSDRPRFLLLVTLYLLQGIPIGLAFGSVPFLLKSSDLSYSQVGIFSLASYPYSLKLLWSPIVDSLFSKKIGRRRSWIIPVQTISGVTLIFLGSRIDTVLEKISSNLYNLTYTFFLLILLCATQDIAVDGWALTILSKDALSYASTAQTIGINTGYFLSFTVFLAFSSPDFANSYLRKIPSDEGVLTLGQYMTFWGWVYLFVTVLIFLFVPEDPLSLSEKVKSNDDSEPKFNEDIPLADFQAHSTPSMTAGGASSKHSSMEMLKSVYSKMWNVVQLRNVKLFIIVHLISKIGFQANEAATNLKLLDKGFSKEDLAITVLIDFPFEIIFGYYAGRWSTGNEPLRPWMYAFLGRIAAAALGQILVWCFPKSGQVNGVYFCFVIFQHLLGSFMSTVQFVSICAFHTQIADPVIGGTYMTTLNTLSNLGGQWPKIIVLNLIDTFTTANCIPSLDDKSPLLSNDIFSDKPYFNCVNPDLKKQCIQAGGECKIIRDGYYSTNILCITIGLVLFYGWIRKTVVYLQGLPVGAWRVGKSHLPI